MRHVVNGTPVVLGGALIVPAGLMTQAAWRRARRSGCRDLLLPMRPRAAGSSALAMDAVRRAEEAEGCRVVDVSAAKCGWDLTSYPPAVNGKQPDPRHIEVKGRVKGDHHYRDAQRDALCVQSGRQVCPGVRSSMRATLWTARTTSAIRLTASPVGASLPSTITWAIFWPEQRPDDEPPAPRSERCEIFAVSRAAKCRCTRAAPFSSPKMGNGKTALLDGASLALSAYVHGIYPAERLKKIKRTDVRLIPDGGRGMKPCLPTSVAAGGVVADEIVHWTSSVRTHDVVRAHANRSEYGMRHNLCVATTLCCSSLRSMGPAVCGVSVELRSTGAHPSRISTKG